MALSSSTARCFNALRRSSSILVENVFSILAQLNMEMHAIARLIVQWLGHEGSGQVMLQGTVVDDVLHIHHLVGDEFKGQ